MSAFRSLQLTLGNKSRKGKFGLTTMHSRPHLFNPACVLHATRVLTALAGLSFVVSLLGTLSPLLLIHA